MMPIANRLVFKQISRIILKHVLFQHGSTGCTRMNRDLKATGLTDIAQRVVSRGISKSPLEHVCTGDPRTLSSHAHCIEKQYMHNYCKYGGSKLNQKVGA